MPQRQLANLNTTPIVPASGASVHPGTRFGKSRRLPGDPVSAPKAYPRFIPPPSTNLTNLELSMDVVLPAQAKEAGDAQCLVFHTLGDVGGIHGDEIQKAISDAMTHQITSPDKKPAAAFCYLLGDIVYFNGESKLYTSQFYEPYQNYPSAIFAIAGNHDGDNHARAGDPVDPEPSLYGFLRNFCDTTTHHDSPYRATMTQPYVYWTLQTPCAALIGLYSNVDGSLDARGTSEQQQWFEQQVANAPTNRALIVSMHHPPYSLDTVHGGYPDVEIAIDRVIKATGRLPSLVLSGHVHSYQRFERNFGGQKVAYVVPGAGGYANRLPLMHRLETPPHGTKLSKSFPTTHADLNLVAYNDTLPGFLRVSVDSKKKTTTIEYFTVPFDGGSSATTLADSATLPWPK